jgi:hypothetical protein
MYIHMKYRLIILDTYIYLLTTENVKNIQRVYMYILYSCNMNYLISTNIYIYVTIYLKIIWISPKIIIIIILSSA